MRQTRLLVLPVLGMLFFVNESYSSYQQYTHSRSTCYWWGAFIALDSKPLVKTVAFEGQGPVTDCEFQEQVIDRFGTRMSLRLFAMTALPAFIASLALAHGIGRFGVNEIPIFIGSTPALIFAWYYFAGLAFQRWPRRRRRRKAFNPADELHIPN